MPMVANRSSVNLMPFTEFGSVWYSMAYFTHLMVWLFFFFPCFLIAVCFNLQDFLHLAKKPVGFFSDCVFIKMKAATVKVQPRSQRVVFCLLRVTLSQKTVKQNNSKKGPTITTLKKKIN